MSHLNTEANRNPHSGQPLFSRFNDFRWMFPGSHHPVSQDWIRPTQLFTRIPMKRNAARTTIHLYSFFVRFLYIILQALQFSIKWSKNTLFQHIHGQNNEHLCSRTFAGGENGMHRLPPERKERHCHAWMNKEPDTMSRLADWLAVTST